jgi:hypothetical protein
MVCNADTRVFIGSGKKCPYVQWVLLLLVLPYTRVLIVGVTNVRERE